MTSRWTMYGGEDRTEQIVHRRQRRLNGVDESIFIDTIVVKVCDGQVANRPFYAAIGVTLADGRHVLGLWGRDQARHQTDLHRRQRHRP